MGFMCFSTQNGLNKYDNYQFTAYRYDIDDKDFPRDNFIESLFEDSDAALINSYPADEAIETVQALLALETQ